VDFFSGVVKRFFQKEPNVVKFHFFSLETTKSTFSAKHVTGQIQISKSRGALSLPASVPTSINSQMRATYFKISMALLRFRKCLH